MSHHQYLALVFRYPMLKTFITSSYRQEDMTGVWDILFGLCHHPNGDEGVVNA